MKSKKNDYTDFSAVSFSSYDTESKTPIKKYESFLAIMFFSIGLFILLISFIVMLQYPIFLIKTAEDIIFSMLPFVSFSEEVIGVIPTSLLFLFLSLGLFLLKDNKRFTFIQCFIAIVSIFSLMYFLIQS